jgi:2-polyprenyl-3-methyl-5-hydroxy-6-metoxy-1,4-benzoquinol methylase
LNLYKELCEYTGLSEDIVKRRCKNAALILAWEFHEAADVLDYYRNSEWYIYDLTYYQNDILGDVFYGWFDKLFAEPLKGMDLGGGIGEYTIHAMKQGCEVDFIDVDGKTLEYAKWRFKKHGVSPDIYNEDFKIDKDYDFIIAMDILEHLENPDERLKEIAAHTKYLFANPGEVKYNILYPQHISRYDLTPYFENLGGYLWRRK